MKANLRAIQNVRDDEGVSPVIAVILMVAITVVLAATVYVWVSGFSNQDSGPESASATARGLDLDNNGQTEWIRMTLVRGENAPYLGSDVTISATDQVGTVIDTATRLCETADLDGAAACTNLFADTETWAVGAVLYVPCGGDGNHAITVSVRGTTILDSVVECDEAAPDVA